LARYKARFTSVIPSYGIPFGTSSGLNLFLPLAPARSLHNRVTLFGSLSVGGSRSRIRSPLPEYPHDSAAERLHLAEQLPAYVARVSHSMGEVSVKTLVASSSARTVNKTLEGFTVVLTRKLVWVSTQPRIYPHPRLSRFQP